MRDNAAPAFALLLVCVPLLRYSGAHGILRKYFSERVATMTYQGHVMNGVVVLDGSARLPEGTRVAVCLFDFNLDDLPEDDVGNSLLERLRPIVGAAEGLPPDASFQVDHYLYGAPRE